jgi:hypothetical protein
MGAEAGIPLTHQPIDALRKKITVTLLKTVHCHDLHVFVRPRSTILPVHQLPKDLDINFNAQRHFESRPYVRTACLRKRPDMLRDNASSHMARTDSSTLHSLV